MTIIRMDPARGTYRSDGRLIVSYPKSGRTWLRFALASFGIEGTATHAGSSTHKTELGYPFKGVLPSLRATPLIFLHRDPLDTAVSLYYQITHRELRLWSKERLSLLVPLALRGAIPPAKIDAFVRHPVYGVENICAYNRAWLTHLAERQDCLVLKYEDMRSDPTDGFQRILDFFKVTVHSGAELAAASDFDRMKKVEIAGEGSLAEQTVTADPKSFKVRRGKVAGFKDELRPETIDACQQIMARYGFATVDATEATCAPTLRTNSHAQACA